ncbi:hypothetical protein [Thiospirillum jenense]|uniref:Uncharacterized protein n=1 Tax=Thiospirillum jenense TaxID=1653858 RepID=A0A839HFI6_9GAMM|nr:hypothetical protein [Thiospirillum jenense]MBB1127391.1 hypothetical protein [Thiospirillum jenense]
MKKTFLSRRNFIKYTGLSIFIFAIFNQIPYVKSEDLAIVTTKEELEKAVNERHKRIIVKGELANDVKTSYKIKSASKAAIAALITALTAVAAAAFFTGGLSLAALVPIAAATGIEIAVITAIVAIGLTLVLAITNNYETIKFKAGKSDAYIELSLVGKE